MTTVSDDFNRANEALTAGPWTLVAWSGVTTSNIVSNECVIESTNRSGAIHDTALSTDDHQVQVRVEDFDVAVFARGDSAGTTGYFANVYSADVELFKVVAGTVTFIDAIGSAAIALGDTLFIAVVGDRITWGKLDGATKTITDTSITTGTRVGIGASGNQGILDDFLAFDFTDQLDLTSLDDAADTTGTLTLDATGATQNAKLCAVITCDGGTYATPAGWTLEDSLNAGSNNTYVFSRVAGAGEGTHDWTRTGGFGGFGRLYQVVGTGTPDIHLTAVNTTSGASTSHTAPAPGTATDPNLTLRHWVQITGTATLTPTQIPLGSTIDNYWPEVASYEFLDAGAIGAVNCASNQNAEWFGVSVVFVEGSGGPANVDLTPAVVTFGAVALDPVPQPVDVNLTPAVVTFGAVALDPVPQPVDVNLTPAVITFEAPALNPSGIPPADVDLTPAVINFTAVPLIPVPGVVDIDLTPAVIVFTAVPLGLGAGPPSGPRTLVAIESGHTLMAVDSGHTLVAIQ